METTTNSTELKNATKPEQAREAPSSDSDLELAAESKTEGEQAGSRDSKQPKRASRMSLASPESTVFKPAKPVKPAKPMKTAKPVKPAKPMKTAKPVKPAKPVKRKAEVPRVSSDGSKRPKLQANKRTKQSSISFTSVDKRPRRTKPTIRGSKAGRKGKSPTDSDSESDSEFDSEDCSSDSDDEVIELCTESELSEPETDDSDLLSDCKDEETDESESDLDMAEVVDDLSSSEWPDNKSDPSPHFSLRLRTHPEILLQASNITPEAWQSIIRTVVPRHLTEI